MFDYHRTVVGWVRLALWAGSLTMSASVALGERGQPAQEGIVNFGKVNDAVYRGAQPSAQGITNLARLGIRAIVNLRMTNGVWKGEEAAARQQGIFYTNLPLAGFSRPTEQQVRMALELIEDLPGPVFIHCEHGCDRTGTIIACYRIKHDNWTSQSALHEARRYGLSRFERGMKKFVLDFGKAMKQKPAEAAK